MARLPTAADLGITSPFSERRIASYDATGFAKGAAALAAGAVDVGKGLAAAATDVAAAAETEQRKAQQQALQDRLQAARAKTEMAVEDITARNETSKEIPSAELPERHRTRLLTKSNVLQEGFLTPEQRDAFAMASEAGIAKSVADVQAETERRYGAVKLDDWMTRGDEAISHAAASLNTAARIRVIDSFSSELDEFALAYPDIQQRLPELKQGFVKKYVFAQGQARVAIDPAGVLHDLDQVQTIAETGAGQPAQGAAAGAPGGNAAGTNEADGHLYEFLGPEQRAILRDQAEHRIQVAQLTTAAERNSLLKQQFEAAGAGAPGVRLPDRVVIESDPELLANPDRQNDLLRHYDAAALAINNRQAAIDKFLDPSQTFSRYDPADREAVDQLYQWWGGGRNIFQALVDRTGIVPSIVPNQIRGLLTSKNVQEVQAGLRLAANLLTNNDQIFKGVEGGQELESAAEWFRKRVQVFSEDEGQAAQQYMLYRANPKDQNKTEDRDPRVENLTTNDLANAFAGWNWLRYPSVGFTGDQRKELLAHYKELVKEYLQHSVHGDLDTAKKLAAKQLVLGWGVSNVNGSGDITGGGVLMMYPPDHVVEGLENAPDFVATDVRAVIKERTGEDVERKALKFYAIPGQTAQAFSSGEPVPYRVGWDDKDGKPRWLPGEPYMVDRDKIAAAITAEHKAKYDQATAVDRQTEDNKLVARGGRGLSPEQREERLAIIAQRKRERDERDGIAPTTKPPAAPPPAPSQERGGQAPAADEKPSGPNLFAPLDRAKGAVRKSGAAEPGGGSEQPSVASVMGAAYRTHNTFGAYFSAEDRGLPQHREKGFNAWDRIVGTQYEKHWHRFVDVRNSEAFEMRRRQIERETADRKILAAAPAYVSLPAQGIAGFVDWPTAIPVGRIYRTAAGGISLLKTGGSFAAEGAISSAVQEGVLHSIQSTRTPEDSMKSIAIGTGLGPFTGPAFNKASGAVRSGVQRWLGGETQEGKP